MCVWCAGSAWSFLHSSVRRQCPVSKFRAWKGRSRRPSRFSFFPGSNLLSSSRLTGRRPTLRTYALSHACPPTVSRLLTPLTPPTRALPNSQSQPKQQPSSPFHFDNVTSTQPHQQAGCGACLWLLSRHHHLDCRSTTPRHELQLRHLSRRTCAAQCCTQLSVFLTTLQRQHPVVNQFILHEVAVSAHNTSQVLVI